MDVKIVCAPYLCNASSDFDETWDKYSSPQHDMQNQGHNQVRVMVRGQRSLMSKSCRLHIFATPCQILTQLGTNIRLIDTIAKPRSKPDPGHGQRPKVKIVKIVSAPYLRNASSDIDETWYKMFFST